jgi:NADH-quinone oxidoreductase subunit C
MKINREEIIKILREELKEELLSAKIEKGRIYVGVSKESLKKAIACLKSHYYTRLCTASSVDTTGPNIDVLYHFDIGPGIVTSIVVRVLKTNLVLESISDLVPGANFIEREIKEYFGIDFKGHPNLVKLMLPEEWPEDEYLLGKKEA